MKLINNTHWQTRDLKKIATRVCREEFPRGRFGDKAKTMQVVVGYNKGGSGASSGHAYYGSRTAYVNVPSGNIGGRRFGGSGGAVGIVDPVDFAFVVAHEFGHCKGLRHGHMPPHMGDSTSHRSDYVKQHFAWAKQFPIRKVVPKKKVRPNVDAKLAHAEVMRNRAVTRVKRAQTILRKWDRAVKRYRKANILTLGQAAVAVAPATP